MAQKAFANMTSLKKEMTEGGITPSYIESSKDGESEGTCLGVGGGS